MYDKTASPSPTSVTWAAVILEEADPEAVATNSLIEGKYLSVCSPEMAYEWLRSRTDYGDCDHHETILLKRNDPLTDFGLARYGWSTKVAKKLYVRLDHATKCAMRACHGAEGGPAEPFLEMDFANEESMQELIAWIYNPHHSDDFFEDLFNQNGVFGRLADDHYLTLIRSAGQNKRLSTPYQSVIMDGWEEHCYYHVFDQAWELTLRVPLTQRWASALESLLQNVVVVRYRPHDFDAHAAIQRWRVDDKPMQADKWFAMSWSFYLRSTIADLLDADDNLLDSNDLALRRSFYKRFDPNEYRNWPDFAERDTSVFFEAALRNVNIWKERRERERLEQVAWGIPDPHSTMDAPNDYRTSEALALKTHPEWFSDDD